MRYERGSRHSNPREDISLASELLSSGVPKSRITEIFKDRLDEEDLKNVVEERNEEEVRSRPISPEIKRLVEEANPPKDFIDPLYMQLMRDPVVLSSGYTVDRSTILDKDGHLRFSRCPFSGKRLNSEVYPLDKLKSQVEYFRMRRDSNITQIARKLIAKEKYESFNDVLAEVDSYLKSLGENYLPLARELAAIWSGVRNAPSTMMLVERLNVKATNKWATVVESGRLEESIYKILVSAEVFKDLGRGSRKSFLALSLYDEVGRLVERCKLFQGSNYGKKHLTCVFGKSDRIISNARPDYTYHLEYMVGSSKQYIQAEGLICKIFPTTYSLSSYRMRDADGEEGLYIGSINSKKLAHGQGSLEYNDGTRFVGKFQKGSMVDGVFYRGSHIRRTMTRGKWTRGIDDMQVEKYPSNMVVYDSAGGTNRMEFEESMKAIDDLYSEEREGPSESDSSHDHKEMHRFGNENRSSTYRFDKQSNHGHGCDRGDHEECPAYQLSRKISSFDDVSQTYYDRKKKSLIDDSSSSSQQLGHFDEEVGPHKYDSKSKDIHEQTNTRRSRDAEDQAASRSRRSKSIDVGDVFPEYRPFNESVSHLSQRSKNVFPDMRGQNEKSHQSSRYDRHNDERSIDIDYNRQKYDSNHPSNNYGEQRSKYVKDDHHDMRDIMSKQRGKKSYDGDGNDKYSFAVEYDNLSLNSGVSERRSRMNRNEREMTSFDAHSTNHKSDPRGEFINHFDDNDSGERGGAYSDELDVVDDFTPPEVPTHKPGSKGPSPTDQMESHSPPPSSPFFGGSKSRSKDVGSVSGHSKDPPPFNLDSMDASPRSPYGKKSRSLANFEDKLERDLAFEKPFSSESRIFLPRESRPYIIHVPKLQRQLRKGGAWLGIAQSGFLEDNVKCLMISVEEYLDQNKKCNLGIALYNETGQFVVRHNVFGNRSKSKGHFKLITDEEKIVSKARPGYFYQLQYAVNTGSIDVLQVKGWICKIFSASEKSLSSISMADMDGDKGIYYGPLSMKGEAHGKGYLEYNNGCTFVGQFVQGELIHGSYYKIDQIKATMKDKEWTNEVDQELYHLFPPSVQVFMREVHSDDIVYENSHEFRSTRDECC